MKRIDRLTHEVFEASRINQFFKSKENRINYHRIQANKLRHKLAYINKPILKSYKVLEELMTGKDEATFHEQYLIGRGVNLEVMTHYEGWGADNYPAIYSFIFMPENKDTVKIIRYDKIHDIND